MTEESFRIGISFLQKLFGHELEPEIYKAYWNILKRYDDSKFKTMIENIVKEFTPTNQVPFPLPKHFLSLVGDTGENRARLAVLAVINASSKVSIYSSVSFGDRALHATIDRFGGWPTVACWSPEDWKFNEKNFIATYEAAVLSGYGPDKLIGIAEFENGKKSLSGRQFEIVQKQEEIKYISWTGFDETLKIENKNSEPVKQLPSGEIASIGEIMAAIGIAKK